MTGALILLAAVPVALFGMWWDYNGERVRERLLAEVPNGMLYAAMTLREHAIVAVCRPRRYAEYLRWRFRAWAVLPGDRFEDFMRQIDYRVAEVRHDYVIAERRTREAAYRGGPWERVRVARPLPPEWWPA